MKFLEKIAILFFDLIDKFFHQKKIINQLKKKYFKYGHLY